MTQVKKIAVAAKTELSSLFEEYGLEAGIVVFIIQVLYALATV